jgi:2-methylcitrate dehydratase PrpD
MDHPGYRRAFVDWMACAWAGRDEPAARAARSGGDDPASRVLALATAGHVLDFDDTYAPGLSHLSAPTAPAALVTGALAGVSIGAVLDAYAAGFEAMGALAGASHPGLYERGWHPTAVTGTVGAATAAAALLGLDATEARHARHLALLGAGGLRAAFGTDGKSLQVGIAAAQGVRAALLAAQGATTSGAVAEGFEAGYGGTWAEPIGRRAIEENWIKAFPCCLQTHSSIEAAAQLRGLVDVEAGGVVGVHRRSRQAAPLDDVATGLEAKFSIPYTVAFTLLHGPPAVADFLAVDTDARRIASRIEVVIDDDLDQSAAMLTWRGKDRPVVVEAAKGSPERPMSDDQLAEKVRLLAGDRFEGVLDDPDRPAADVLSLVQP